MSAIHKLRTKASLALAALKEGDAGRAVTILEQATTEDGINRQDSLMRFEDRLTAFDATVVRRAKELRLVAAAVVVCGHGRDDMEFVFTFHGEPNLVKFLKTKFGPAPMDPFKNAPGPAPVEPDDNTEPPKPTPTEGQDA